MTRKHHLAITLAALLLSQITGLAQARKNITVSPSDNVITHVADGGQWSTSITLVNLSNFTASFTLHFYGDDGSPLALPFVGGSGFPTSTLSGTLPVNGSRTFQTTGAPGPTVQGWAQLDSNEDVGGFAVFKSHLAGQKDSEAVVPIGSRFDARSVLVFDNTNGYVIGVALVNPSTFDIATVILTFRDENGNQFDQDSFLMDPLTHDAFSLAQAYPQTIGRKGTVEISTTSVTFSALGLRFSPAGPFTSFHTLSAAAWR
jgi:hypothetical protein